MRSVQWAAGVLEAAAEQWEEGRPFEENEDAQSILRTVESVYTMVGDSHEELGRTCTAIGLALSAWRNGEAAGRSAPLLRDMARCFRDAAAMRDEAEANW
jgi:hypothetical protein